MRTGYPYLLYQSQAAVWKPFGKPFDLVSVTNDSEDQTGGPALCVKLINFLRNFDHLAVRMAGVDYTTCDIVISDNTNCFVDLSMFDY